MAQTLHTCYVTKGTSDATDFESNYKSSAEAITHSFDDGNNFEHEISYSTFKTAIDGTYSTWADVRYQESDRMYTLYKIDGFQQIMASSRPKGTTVCFVTAGDKTSSPQAIHGGTEMKWDFSNTDGDVTAPSGFKRKQFDLQFIDSVWLKEGTVYFHNAPKGAYVSFQVICPNGQYYKKNDGTVAQATADTVIHNYVAKHYIQGDCPMGDELNTEAAQLDPLPSNYYMRLTVTTPDTDSTSNGFGEIELYRSRTVILE